MTAEDMQKQADEQSPARRLGILSKSSNESTRSILIAGFVLLTAMVGNRVVAGQPTASSETASGAAKVDIVAFHTDYLVFQTETRAALKANEKAFDDLKESSKRQEGTTTELRQTVGRMAENLAELTGNSKTTFQLLNGNRAGRALEESQRKAP